MATADGSPVEFFFTPKAVGDVKGLEVLDSDLPDGVTSNESRIRKLIEPVLVKSTHASKVWCRAFLTNPVRAECL
jgi:hypothetical protein